MGNRNDFAAVLVDLHHAQGHLEVLWVQAHPEVPVHPFEKEVVTARTTARYKDSTSAKRETYSLSRGPFISGLTLGPAVSSAATRSTISLLSSLALQKSSEMCRGAAARMQMSHL